MNILLPQATQDLIQQYMEALPEYMQEALDAIDWTAEIARIGAKHRLGQQQIVNLTVETAMTIFGISQPELFYSNIMNHIGVSGSIAESITHDIAERIFERVQQVIHDEYGDQIMLLQQELDDLEKEEETDTTRDVLEDMGIELGGGEVIAGESASVENSIADTIPHPRVSLAEQKLAGSFSLDTHEVAPVHYPDADPYHEDFATDDEPQASLTPPAPPRPTPHAEDLIHQGSVPSMMVPPMPPTPPKK
ncbi:hypothetical protein H6776_00210 [Candidatus Nomurabacteria bacterium]|nr:hypothetical protein [Candidatus Nomurabacteria bacterium]